MVRDRAECHSSSGFLAPELPPPSYQIQALELEAIHSTSLAAIHIVPQGKYDLSKRCRGVGQARPCRLLPPPKPTGTCRCSKPLPTSNICFSFWEDLTEAEAAMMALSCWKAR